MATTSNKNNAAAEKAAAEKKEAAEKAAKQGKTVMVPALSVIALRHGFRRGGLAWVKGEVVVIKLSELTKDQIAQIKGEAQLTVTEVEVDEEVAE